MNDTLTVTSPQLPYLAELKVLMEQIWEERWITNRGCFHRQLEEELARYLDVPYIGTSHIKGQIITPPYSFVATTYGTILRSGDLFSISFHVPKMFNTIKGARLFLPAHHHFQAYRNSPTPRGRTFPVPSNWPSR